jgi:hypothetical protein
MRGLVSYSLIASRWGRAAKQKFAIRAKKVTSFNLESLLFEGEEQYTRARNDLVRVFLMGCFLVLLFPTYCLLQSVWLLSVATFFFVVCLWVLTLGKSHSPLIYYSFWAFGVLFVIASLVIVNNYCHYDIRKPFGQRAVTLQDIPFPPKWGLYELRDAVVLAAFNASIRYTYPGTVIVAPLVDVHQLPGINASAITSSQYLSSWDNQLDMAARWNKSVPVRMWAVALDTQSSQTWFDPNANFALVLRRYQRYAEKDVIRKASRNHELIPMMTSSGYPSVVTLGQEQTFMDTKLEELVYVGVLVGLEGLWWLGHFLWAVAWFWKVRRELDHVKQSEPFGIRHASENEDAKLMSLTQKYYLSL